MFALLNGAIYTPLRLIADGVVLIEGQRIVAAGAPDQTPIPDAAERIDARGQIICPAFVDIHVHGGDNADCTDGSAEAVRAVARRHLRAGTTSLFATTASAPLPRIWQAFDAIQEVMAHPRPDEAQVLGIHMEGPFLAASQRGAHAAELLRMPTADERERLYGYIGRGLARVTIAPECEGALPIIAHLARHGVLVSGGHSDALYEQTCLAMQAGMRHITHLWSSMSTVRRIGPKRYAGMLEAALIEDELSGEIIADGYHLPSSLMKMAYRLKGPERLCMVSDAMRASGMGPGTYGISGLEALVEEGAGVAITADRTAFAGSISTMQQCVQHVVQVVGWSLGDALRMATLTPATIMGCQQQMGSLAPGRQADLLVLDRATLEARLIMARGRIVLDKLSPCP